MSHDEGSSMSETPEGAVRRKGSEGAAEYNVREDAAEYNVREDAAQGHTREDAAGQDIHMGRGAREAAGHSVQESVATSNRKLDHIRINLEDDVAAKGITTGLERYRFEHCALPEIDLDEIDTSTVFLGHTLRLPLLISSMTGGVVTRTAWICRLIVCAPAPTLPGRKRRRQTAARRPTLLALRLFREAKRTQLRSEWMIDIGVHGHPTGDPALPRHRIRIPYRTACCLY